LKINNILIAGVGGQGLVLTTKLLAEAAFAEGYDLKTNDIIGLSQRGGMVWGSVRFGSKVHSAQIPQGEVDILLAMEQLEALRWSYMLRENARIIFNSQCIYPNKVLIEKDEYPQNIKESLEAKGFEVASIDAKSAAKGIGNLKVMNLILLGKLSLYLPFRHETWLNIIEKNVTPSMLELNQKAFILGKTLK